MLEYMFTVLLCSKPALIFSLQDLSNNAMGQDGARGIGEVIRFNRSLIRMNLAGNKFGDMGMDFMSPSLKVTQLQQSPQH